LQLLAVSCIFIDGMKTKVVKIDIANIDSAKIKEAAQAIEAGLLVAFPTETVYGIGCRVEAGSLAKLNSIKNRSPDKYYTLHISRPDGAKRYVPHIGLRAKKTNRGLLARTINDCFRIRRAKPCRGTKQPR
jgi:L-threonylcarbamoyladenylate synthase